MSNWEEAVEHMKNKPRPVAPKRTVQEVNNQSCQYCGCDPGANHLCETHRLLTHQQDPSLISPTASVPTAAVSVAKGIGGAPTRATTLPCGPAERKQFPVASGVLDYFPDAIVALALLSYKGNLQHNAGKPLHWDRSKSSDESDTMMRHFLQRGTLDTDGVPHTVKMTWRALAILQKELENQ